MVHENVLEAKIMKYSNLQQFTGYDAQLVGRLKVFG